MPPETDVRDPGARTARDAPFADIRTLRARYRDGSLLPSEFVAATFRLLDRWEPDIGAFLTVARERATAEARAADRLLHREGPGAWRGRPLLGMPVTVKDLTATEGIRTTRGSLLNAHTVPDRDAPAVARLRAAGAIVVGKTNTSEGGWSAAGKNRLQGPTRNPWDLSRSSGGSSAGAAASVAVGIGVGATGTDGSRLHPGARRVLRRGRVQTVARPRPVRAAERRGALPPRAAHPDRRGRRRTARGDGRLSTRTTRSPSGCPGRSAPTRTRRPTGCHGCASGGSAPWAGPVLTPRSSPSPGGPSRSSPPGATTSRGSSRPSRTRTPPW